MTDLAIRVYPARLQTLASVFAFCDGTFPKLGVFFKISLPKTLLFTAETSPCQITERGSGECSNSDRSSSRLFSAALHKGKLLTWSSSATNRSLCTTLHKSCFVVVMFSEHGCVWRLESGHSYAYAQARRISSSQLFGSGI